MRSVCVEITEPKNQLIVREIVRRLSGMRMQFAGLASVCTERYDPSRVIWGLVTTPGAMCLPAGRRLPCEQYPAQYTGRAYTIAFNWLGELPRYAVRVYPRYHQFQRYHPRL